MTLAVEGFAGRDRSETTRWVASLVVVLLLHGALALFAMSRQVGVEPAGAPPSAVMIDLAPPPPEPLPPEPIVQPQVQPEALPEPPPPPPELDLTLPEPDLLPPPKAAVTLPAKPPPPRPRPVEPPREVVPERPPPAAAPAVPAPPAPQPAPAANPAARSSWQAEVASKLERNKRYPRTAQAQHEEGVAYLRFALDRSGNVLAASIERSSGHSLLDEEVLALVQRAAPLPAPPPEVPGARIELVVPVRFSMNR